MINTSQVLQNIAKGQKKCLLVGGTSERGVAAVWSYETRLFAVNSGI